MKILLVISFLSWGVESLACGAHQVAAFELPKDFFISSNRKPSQAILPQFVGPGYETRLGNLVLENRKEVVISFPAKIYNSETDRPFGDGQTNAKLDMGKEWNKSDGFIVIGIQTKNKGKVSRSYKFNSKLNVKDYTEEKLGNGYYRVKPKDWGGDKPYFYFNFDTSTLTVKSFLKGIPTPLRTFSGQRVAPDPEKIGRLNAYEKLNSPRGEGYSKDQPWLSAGVHDFFKGERTAIGGVKTWGIVEPAFGPFKQLYTCFDERRVENEIKFQVPSGAGWHRVGDPAETLINNLENLPIPAALGRTHNLEGAAYDLSEVVTAFWLTTNYVFVTSQTQFHWYVNPYPKVVCTEIWVHNCVPNLTNNWGVNCK